MALLHGRYRISDREIPQLLHDFFALLLSLGSVVDLQQSCSLALAPISSAIQTTVQQQAHITMDETGWKEAGKRRWFTQRVPGGGQRGCNTLSCSKQPWCMRLLGSALDGIVSSDRLKSYQVLPAERRQICWAHLIRTRIAFYERDGPLGWWAAGMLAQVDLMFGLWYAFRDGRIERHWKRACSRCNALVNGYRSP